MYLRHDKSYKAGTILTELSALKQGCLIETGNHFQGEAVLKKIVKNLAKTECMQ